MNKSQKRSWFRLPDHNEERLYWGVYETEYPEDGSVPYYASTAEKAIRLHRKATGDKDTGFSATPITKAQYDALMEAA